MNLTRISGHLLLWVGFLVGAFVSVRSVEVKETPWLTISWPAYAAALCVAVVGVIILRSTKRPVRVASSAGRSDCIAMAAVAK